MLLNEVRTEVQAMNKNSGSNTEAIKRHFCARLDEVNTNLINTKPDSAAIGTAHINKLLSTMEKNFDYLAEILEATSNKQNPKHCITALILYCKNINILICSVVYIA